MLTAEKEKVTRTLTPNHLRQITVLKTLSGGLSVTQPRQFEISEIAELSGIPDEREVQRYLFILEGQKLVSPFPAHDFTSNRWHITQQGLKAVQLIDSHQIQ